MTSDRGLRRAAVIHAYPHQYAGSQRVVHELALRLPQFGWSLLTVLPDDGPFAERLRRDDLDTSIVTAPRLWRRYGRTLNGPLLLPALTILPLYWLQLARALRRAGIEVAHCNDHRGMLLGGPAARLAGIPCVWHLHNASGPPILTRFGGAIATWIVSNSQATLDALPVLARRAGKITTVYFGVPSQSAAAPSHPDASGGRIVLCGGRLHPSKGQDLLIEAAPSVLRRHPTATFQLAGGAQKGSEAYAERLRAAARAHGLDQTVDFLGFVEDTVELWRAADVYVQPSRDEPFGLGVLEAMMLGKPVVASAVGGLRELVIDGETGLLVAPGDARALSDAICRILDDPALAARMGAAGAERARSTFSIESAVQAIAATYAQLTSP